MVKVNEDYRIGGYIGIPLALESTSIVSMLSLRDTVP